MMKKIAMTTVAALTIGATIALAAAPAEARNGRKGALIGGIAAGLLGAAIVGSQARGRGEYEEERVQSDCWIEKRPRYDRYGEFRGYRRIRVCN
jgi:heme/copper-type cytochrome/quinol oxidase subunit 3